MAQTIAFRKLPRKIRMAIEDAVADEYPGKNVRYGNFTVEESGTGKFKRRMRDDGDVDHFAIIDVKEGRLSSPLDELELHPGYAMAVFSVTFDDTVEGSLFIRGEDYGDSDVPDFSSSDTTPVTADELDIPDDFEANPKRRSRKKTAKKKAAKKKTAKKKTAKKTTKKRASGKSKEPALIVPEEHPLLHIRETQKDYVERVLKGIFGWNYKTSGVLNKELMKIYVADAKLAHSTAKKKKLVER